MKGDDFYLDAFQGGFDYVVFVFNLCRMNIKRFRKSYNIKFIRVIPIKDKNGDFIEFLLDLNCCI